MADYLKKHASEVVNMLFTEFNMDDAKRIWREEALEEGMEKGMEKAAESIAVNLLRRGIGAEIVAESVGIPLEKVLRLQGAGTNN